MTTITLEVPEDLAAQINAERQIVPELLRRAFAEEKRAGAEIADFTAAAPIQREVIGFLASQPSLEQVAEFKISDAAQERLEALLERNRAAELTPAERQELDKYLQYRHVLILLKASARRVIG